VIYLISATLTAVSGYVIGHHARLLRKNLAYDIALGWFIGSGYFSLAYLAVQHVTGVAPMASISVGIVALPLLSAGYRWREFSGFVAETLSRHKLRQEKISFSAFEAILVAVVVAVVLLAVFHGISTPTNGDDALRSRGYHPLLVHAGVVDINNSIFHNGIWPNYAPLLSWHLNGSADHFYLNYGVLTLAVFFMVLVYTSPAQKRNTRQGLYSLFLVVSIPLFVFHMTSTYIDIFLIVAVALGYLFFSLYIRDGDETDLNTSIIFFTLVSFAKTKGIITGLTGFGFIGMYLVREFWENRRLPSIRVAGFGVPFLLFLAIKEYHDPMLSGLFRMAAGAPADIIRQSNEVMPDNTVGEKSAAFWHSLFISGNFGIHFYLLIGATVAYFRRIFSTKLVWDFLFLSAIFFETYYFMVYWYVNMPYHQSILHRVVMMLSVICALFLATCFARGEDEGEIGETGGRQGPV